MIAEVTYNAGASYRFFGFDVLFLKDQTKTIDNADLIEKALNTPGFTVRVLEYDKPKRRIMKKAIKDQEGESKADGSS